MSNHGSGLHSAALSIVRCVFVTSKIYLTLSDSVIAISAMYFLHLLLYSIITLSLLLYFNFFVVHLPLQELHFVLILILFYKNTYLELNYYNYVVKSINYVFFLIIMRVPRM